MKEAKKPTTKKSAHASLVINLFNKNKNINYLKRKLQGMEEAILANAVDFE